MRRVIRMSSLCARIQARLHETIHPGRWGRVKVKFNDTGQNTRFLKMVGNINEYVTRLTWGLVRQCRRKKKSDREIIDEILNNSEYLSAVARFEEVYPSENVCWPEYIQKYWVCTLHEKQNPETVGGRSGVSGEAMVKKP